jgi:hypothetical protein
VQQAFLDPIGGPEAEFCIQYSCNVLTSTCAGPSLHPLSVQISGGHNLGGPMKGTSEICRLPNA